MVFIMCMVILVLLLLAAVLMTVKSREKFSVFDKGFFEKNDFLAVSVLVILSAFMLFSSLGDKDAPKTSIDVAKTPIAFAFNSPEYVETLMIYPISNEINGISKLYVSYTDENGKEFHKELKNYNVYSWYPLNISGKISRLVIYADGKTLHIGEIGFLSRDSVIKADASIGTLYLQTEKGFEKKGFDEGVFDEQHLVPLRADYTNGMYFDEIFHARTAKEYIDQRPAYEWTHPPFGKILISEGIRMFGMNPFGWRFASALFGTLAVAVIYLFAKLVTRNSFISFTAGMLMVFDFMHHVQSRIGTVDVLLVFFIMLMYMFLYMAFAKENVRYLPLLLSGISFGLAFSVKWSAAYAVLGVGILLLLRIFKRNEKNGERMKLICFSVVAFALIPICIYIISYIPFVSADGKTGFEAIVENQMKILSYHGGESVELAHDFSSRWYTWAFDIKPIMYYSAWQDCETYGAIYAFGNPVIWWLGAAAVVLNVFLAVLKKDKKAVFLLTGYFSCLLPWIFISRQTFIYHYYPCTVFMLLLIANCLLYIKERKTKTAYVLCAVTVIFSASVFTMFLPAIRGTMANATYIERFLSWLPDWNL